MTMFMSTISGKIDAKGRVSVPSVFRSAISAQNGAAQSGAPQGIFVYPSFTENAIEGGGNTLMNDIGAMVERLNLCLLYTSPSPRDRSLSRMPSSA